MVISGIRPSQALQTELLAYARQQQRENASTILPASWGEDRVTLSDAALARLEGGSGAVAPAGAVGGSGAPVPAGGSSAALSGVLNIDGEEVDAAGRLQAIGLEDFGAFRELLDKLGSGDASQMVEALAEITGKPVEDVREAVSGLDSRQLAALISQLTGVSMSESSRIVEETRSLMTMDGR